MKRNDKLFASAGVKTREHTLVDTERLRRMIAENLEGAVRVLYEISYAGGFTVQQPQEYQKILDAEFSAHINYFKTVCPDRAILELFLKQYDYQNAKALVKAKFLKLQNADNLLYGEGLIPSEKLKDSISSENYALLPRFMREALDTLDIAFTTDDKNPRLIDVLLDKAYYAEIAEGLKTVSDSLVKSYFLGKIDTTNLITALRCRLLSYSASDYMFQFIPGGTLQLSAFKPVLEQTAEEAREKFRNTPYSALAELCLESVSATGSITTAETAAADFLAKIFYGRRNEMLTLYPLLNFHMSKLSELRNLKLIFTCLSSGAGRTEITRRLIYHEI